MENPKAIINLNNLDHNIDIIYSKLAQHNKSNNILAVIKANAYGHGAINIAKHLDNNKKISAYGVARISEALELTANNIKKSILLLEGINNIEQLEISIQNNYCLVIHSNYQLDLIYDYFKSLSSLFAKTPIKIWIKLDTGMNRLGFDNNLEDLNFDKLINLIKNKVINNHIILMSHLSCADDVNNNFSLTQHNRFIELQNIFIDKIKRKINGEINNINIKSSLLNSAGIFNNLLENNNKYFDWARPGLALYGASPIINKSNQELGLKPVMSIYSKIISVKNIAAGESVGYGNAYISENNIKIAIIACGYADFYLRLNKNIFNKNRFVYINNNYYKIIGIISMDMIAIDISDQNTVINIGDIVEILGENIFIDELALSSNTIPHEIFAKIGTRVEKGYTKN